uniref:Uncharacterized protein n=1 Tax=Daucus carota subsp. sativus TaxID=79200 RepID=A0A166CNK2_DAUCS
MSKILSRTEIQELSFTRLSYSSSLITFVVVAVFAAIACSHSFSRCHLKSFSCVSANITALGSAS